MQNHSAGRTTEIIKRYIYHLIDPRNGEVFYVGQTIDPGQRLKEHVSGKKSTNLRRSRMQEILKTGMAPIMKTITAVTGTYRDACKVEYEEMARFPKDQLTNGKHYGRKGIRQ